MEGKWKVNGRQTEGKWIYFVLLNKQKRSGQNELCPLPNNY